jgi:pimeloyl-ACP methyl ester carboxylesterase
VTLKTTGITRYRLHDGAGRMVVLIPGVSYPMEVYNVLFDELVAAGRAVLVYDVTGRGYSHSSGEPMSAVHFVQQLVELLASLKLEARQLELVAWSLGGVIASNFILKNPSRVSRLVLLAPTGAIAPQKPLTAKLLHVPFGVGNLLASAFVPSTLRKLYWHELGNHTDGGKMVNFLCDHADRNGALPRTIVSTLRSCPEIDDNQVAYTALGATKIPTLVAWGTLDGTINRASIDALMAQLGPSSRLFCIEGEKHAALVTSPDKLNAEVIAFLSNSKP